MPNYGAVLSGDDFSSSTLTGIKNKTRAKISKELHNAAYEDIAYLKAMDTYGGVVRGETGNGVHVKLIKSKDDTSGARWLRDPYPLRGQDTHGIGYQDFGEYSAAFSIDFSTMQKNSGPEAIIDYFATGVDEMKRTIKDTVNTGLLTGSGALPNIIGIDSLIPETVSSGTLHGIDRSSNVWWRPTATDSSVSTTDGFALVGIKELDKLIKDISEGQGMNPINLAVTDKTTHNNVTYYGLAVQNSRYVISNGGNVPAKGTNFENDVELFIGNAPLIWDSNAPSDSIRLFSTDNVKIHIVKGADFVTLDRKYAEDSFSSNIACGVILAHVNHNPKRSGVLYNFTS